MCLFIIRKTIREKNDAIILQKVGSVKAPNYKNTNITPGNSVLMFVCFGPIIIHVLYILTDIRAYSVVSCHKPKLEQNS